MQRQKDKAANSAQHGSGMHPLTRRRHCLPRYVNQGRGDQSSARERRGLLENRSRRANVELELLAAKWVWKGGKGLNQFRETIFR